MTTTDDKLLALRLLDLAASKRLGELEAPKKKFEDTFSAETVLMQAFFPGHDERLRFTLHDARIDQGVTVAGSVTGYDGYALGPRPATNHGGPDRKSPVRERYCGGVSCAPGLNGRCTACHDDN